jgi:hypothetical protein
MNTTEQAAFLQVLDNHVVFREWMEMYGYQWERHWLIQKKILESQTFIGEIARCWWGNAIPFSPFQSYPVCYTEEFENSFDECKCWRLGLCLSLWLLSTESNETVVRQDSGRASPAEAENSEVRIEYLFPMMENKMTATDWDCWRLLWVNALIRHQDVFNPDT